MDYKFAEKLTVLRKQNNYSQEALAEKLHVSRQAISKWERGESMPDTENLRALAKLYSVSLDSFFDDGIPNVKNAAEADNGDLSAEEIRKRKIRKGYTFPYPIIATILFILGTFVFPFARRYAWLMLLTIPVYYTTVVAISRRNWFAFTFPVVAVIIYFAVCLTAGHWFQMLLIFLSIPVYYYLVIMQRGKGKQ